MKIDIARIFVSAVVRKLAFVLVVAVLAWVGIGKAHAEVVNGHEMSSCSAGNGNYCLTSTQAKASAEAAATGKQSALGASWKVCPSVLSVVGSPHAEDNKYRVSVKWHTYSCDPSGPETDAGEALFHGPEDDTCPDGYGFDPFAPAECLNEQKCLARNPSLGGAMRTATAQSECRGGCQYGMFSGFSKTEGPGGSVYGGVTSYNGAACGGLTPPPDDVDPPVKPQECVPSGTNQYVCVKPNGDQCYTMSPGNQACWKPGQTGQQTDANFNQTRVAGTTEIPPPTTLPNGDTLTRTGTSTTTTHTTINGGTIVTTTTNYTTVNGTNAGTTNTGEPSDGTGGPPGGEDGDGNGLTGGKECTSAPVPTGDPLLGSIVLQTWKTRCQGEDNKSSGAGNCEAPFTCSGEEILCALAMEKRKERCDAELANTQNRTDAAAITAEGDGLEGISVEAAFHTFDEGNGVNANLIGGGDIAQCDFAFTLGGQMLEMDDTWWSVVALIKFMLVAMAYLWIARQLGAK